MSKNASDAQYIARRAELHAQLFLQDIGATFVSVPTADIGYDFVVGFPNNNGGLNFSVIEVKSTERPQPRTYALSPPWFNRLAYTNLPAMLLVIDVKQNHLYCAWPKEVELEKHTVNGRIRVPLFEIDEAMKPSIRAKLAATDIELGNKP